GALAASFPTPSGASPPSVSWLAQTAAHAAAVPVDSPPSAVALSESAAPLLAAPPPAVLATALPIPGALSTSSGSRVVPTAAPIPGATAASSASCVPLSESEPLSAAASSPAVLATALPIPGALSTSSGSPVVPTAAPIPGAAAASCFSGCACRAPAAGAPAPVSAFGVASAALDSSIAVCDRSGLRCRVTPSSAAAVWARSSPFCSVYPTLARDSMFEVPANVAYV